MEKYKSLTRATIGDMADLPHTGVYVIAYMGTVLYVGKADNISLRIVGHITNRGRELIGTWLDAMRFDWHNVRLDALESPDDSDAWTREAEDELIRRFKPLFNTQLMG